MSVATPSGPAAGGKRRPPALGRPFTLLLTASGCSNLADGLVKVGLPLLAVRISDSPAVVAGVTVVGQAARLAAALPTGALNDRFDRRRTMVLVCATRAGLLALFAVALGAGATSVAGLYAVAFALGVGEAFFDSASPALLPSVVDKEQLARANGRHYAVTLGTNEFAGPPLVGFLIALSRALPWAVAAVLYACAARILSGITLPKAATPREDVGAPGEGLLRRIGDGLRHIRGNRPVLVVVVWAALANFAGSITFSVLVLYAVRPGPLGLSTVEFGLVTSALGCGSLIGSLVAARLVARVGPRDLLSLASAGMAVDSAALALSDAVLVVVPALLVAAGAASVFGVVAATLVQTDTPESYLGRVAAAFQALSGMGSLLGAALAGTLGQLSGDLRTAFASAAGVFVLLCLLRGLFPGSTGPAAPG